MKLTIRLKGGPGSGNHGHKGIPGHQGGSLPRGESNFVSHPMHEDVPAKVSHPMHNNKFKLSPYAKKVKHIRYQDEYDLTVNAMKDKGLNYSNKQNVVDYYNDLGVINNPGTVTWDDGDVYSLYKALKSYVTKGFSNAKQMIRDDKTLHKVVTGVLKKSDINLSEGDMDELTEYLSSFADELFE